VCVRPSEYHPRNNSKQSGGGECVWDGVLTCPLESKKIIQPFEITSSKKWLKFFLMIWLRPPAYHKPAGVCKTDVQGL
jgi:hypothetical protein